MIDELDAEGVKALIRGETRNVMVDFWSPWCAPCRTLRPHVDRLAEERKGTWRVVAVNTERYPEAAEAFGVHALPTFAFFSGGQELDRLAGQALPSTIESKLDEHTKLRAV